jgi:hypothetical protein
VLQAALNLSHYHLDCDRIVAAPRHYHIGVTLARLDELAVHRLYGREVLVNDLIERPAAIAGVTFDSPNQSDVRIGVHEYLDVAKIPHSRIDEQENSVDDDYIRGLDPSRSLPAQVSEEVVLRLVDRLTPAQSFEVGAEQIIVERIRVIPVELPALVESE